uniref:tRNA methyltransferase 10 homolog B n=1 Tax=Anas platyrhynchos TaxID=8839 RepID=A0A8B9ZCX0_ANAPL
MNQPVPRRVGWKLSGRAVPLSLCATPSRGQPPPTAAAPFSGFRNLSKRRKGDAGAGRPPLRPAPPSTGSAGAERSRGGERRRWRAAAARRGRRRRSARRCGCSASSRRPRGRARRRGRAERRRARWVPGPGPGPGGRRSAAGPEPCVRPAAPQRNVLRKRRRWERVLAARRRRRRQERERSRVSRLCPAGAARRHSKALAEQRLLEARAAGPRLCVDLGMADRMSLKETSRLASQIRRLYGANRQAEKPFWLYLTEFVVGSLIYEECFRMNDGFSNYLNGVAHDFTVLGDEHVLILFLVLEDIDPKKVYILGGLVDESIHKKLTLRRAQEQSLQTARLPIREYMVKAVNTKNYHSETLAINQVFDVLSTYYKTRSWPDALKAGVSSGKGYVLPDAEK